MHIEDLGIMSYAYGKQRHGFLIKTDSSDIADKKIILFGSGEYAYMAETFLNAEGGVDMQYLVMRILHLELMGR